MPEHFRVRHGKTEDATVPRFVIIDSMSGHPIQYTRPQQIGLDTRGVVLSFLDAMAAAFFIIDQNLNPRRFYWKEEYTDV